MRSAKQKQQINESEASGFGFDLLADSYDNWYASRRGAMYDRLEKELIVNFLPAEAEGKKLLEVGCGTGHWSKFFSARGFEVIGIDISERMIKIAKNKNIAHSSFHVADGHSTPFADSTFDIAAAITTLEFAADSEAMIAEMVRCVRKPGGKLLLGVLNALCDHNQERRNRPGSPYASAKLFSPERLSELLKPLGPVQMMIAGFVPRHRWLLVLAPIFEFVGRLASSQHGAFIAAEVRL